jgi:hypothetical protein
MEAEKLSKIMTEIHAQMAEKARRDRKAAIQRHNDKTHVRSPNYQVRDDVLVAEDHKSGTSKMQVQICTPPNLICEPLVTVCVCPIS